MKFLIQIIIIIALIIIQSSLYPYLQVYNAFPNLILILVLIIAISKGYKQGLIWIILGGFLLDVYSYHNLIGISILALLLIAYLASKLAQNIFKKTSIYALISIGIGASLTYQILLSSILLITGIEFQFSFAQIFFQVIYNLIILIPFFYLIKKFQHA